MNSGKATITRKAILIEHFTRERKKKTTLSLAGRPRVICFDVNVGIALISKHVFSLNQEDKRNFQPEPPVCYLGMFWLLKCENMIVFISRR